MPYGSVTRATRKVNQQFSNYKIWLRTQNF